MSRFFVTGATGFIGSAVIRRLAAEGQEVVAMRGARQPPASHPGVSWLEADLLASGGPQLAALLAETGVTHCIHAAWYTNHSDYLTHGVNRDWVTASIRLAEAFAAAGGRRFTGLGTCLEYDVSHLAGPCSEDRTPLRPATLYSACKLDLLRCLESGNLDIAWARVFFVYGPGDRGGRLVPDMLDRFARGETAGPINGGLRRDYIHVDDLAGQLVRIAASDMRGAINTGTGDAPTLAEVFAEGASAFGRPELARSNDEIGGQPPIIQSELTRFRDTVGEPQARAIAEGLKSLVA